MIWIIKKIRNFFTVPEPGQIYVFRTRNPFEEAHEVEIKAVKSGFVNYKMLSGKSIFQDEVMMLPLFKSIYKQRND